MSNITFNNFNEIEHLPLRVFNRVVTSFNISADYGRHELEKYVGQFNPRERLQMAYMTKYIKQHGPEKARADVTKDLVLPEEK